VLEAGLGFAVKVGKKSSKFGQFIGCNAFVEKKEKGPERRLMQFLLDDPEIMLYHNEPILRNGEVVSFLTSGSYGHALGASVGLGYVDCEAGASDEEVLSDVYTLEVAGEVQTAKVSLKPMFDPRNTKIRV
jgi:4-methylaminobutanoate oxidase (formaldehyde-forming)